MCENWNVNYELPFWNTGMCFHYVWSYMRVMLFPCSCKLIHQHPWHPSFILEILHSLNFLISPYYIDHIYEAHMRLYTEEFLSQNQYSLPLALLPTFWEISQISKKVQIAHLTLANSWVWDVSKLHAAHCKACHSIIYFFGMQICAYTSKGKNTEENNHHQYKALHPHPLYILSISVKQKAE